MDALFAGEVKSNGAQLPGGDHVLLFDLPPENWIQ